LLAFAPLRASRWRARFNLLRKLSNSIVQISLPPLGCGDCLRLRDWALQVVDSKSGGGREIRTLEGLSPSPVFKTGAFNRSAIPPQRAKPAYYYNIYFSQLTFCARLSEARNSEPPKIVDFATFIRMMKP